MALGSASRLLSGGRGRNLLYDTVRRLAVVLGKPIPLVGDALELSPASRERRELAARGEVQPASPVDSLQASKLRERRLGLDPTHRTSIPLFPGVPDLFHSAIGGHIDSKARGRKPCVSHHSKLLAGGKFSVERL
jgi:hypothetical protein